MPERIFLRQAFAGTWRLWTWKQAGDEIRRMAASLRSLQLPPGSNVAILSKNCAHWILSDLAIWMAGHVSIPLYPTLTAGDIRAILEHSGSRAIFLGKLDDFDSQRDGIQPEMHRISFPDYGPQEGIAWSDIIREHAPMADGDVTPADDHLATIIYTSGTTGKPKGVMITVRAFDYVTSTALREMNLEKAGEQFFSYLPLSHIAERMLVEMGAIYNGATISFSESLEKFPQNLVETQPTIFLAVPRIWSKFQEKILERMPQQKLDRLLGIPLIRGLVRSKIRHGLGLSRARWILTGAAPMRASLMEWFDKLGIVIRDVYGMTENLAYSHANVKGVKYGTAGQKWPGVEVRLSEEGEIMVRHAGMMKGYFREPELTAETFTEDAFLRTGDIGTLDAEGFLRITGRVKDQFKTDKGKYIAPSPIEVRLMKNPDIEQACVVGTGLPQPIVLITLSATGKSRSRIEVAQSLEKSLQDLNRELQSYELLEKAVVLREEWTIGNGLLTPTLKVKRNLVEKRHQSQYARWFQSDGTVVWD